MIMSKKAYNYVSVVTSYYVVTKMHHKMLDVLFLLSSSAGLNSHYKYEEIENLGFKLRPTHWYFDILRH